eukprot:c18469_g1_i2.p1 GENE.c18469_g1_i2~~c18469_g1_i2.p1  ORF type:complete len:282 (+),score=102.40 c18469_g1_i2:243-1088(+)
MAQSLETPLLLENILFVDNLYRLTQDCEARRLLGVARRIPEPIHVDEIRTYLASLDINKQKLVYHILCHPQLLKDKNQVSEITGKLLEQTEKLNGGTSEQNDQQKMKNKKKRNLNQNQNNGSNKRKKNDQKQICYHWQRGNCRLENCRFLHEGGVSRIPKICRFFKSGHCVKGDGCPYSHDLSFEPCRYHHLKGFCNEGENCRFSHEPISEERRAQLMVELDQNAPKQSQSDYLGVPQNQSAQPFPQNLSFPNQSAPNMIDMPNTSRHVVDELETSFPFFD